MSVVQLLDHLHRGDIIIVQGGAVAPVVAAAAVDTVNAPPLSPRDLLRNLIAARKVRGNK